MKIFEIIAKYQQLFDKEELSTEDENNILAFKENIEEFATQIAAHIKNMDAECNQIEKAIETMEERHASLCERIEKKEKFLLKLMSDNHIESIRTCPWFVIKIQKGRERVDDFDRKLIPKDYYRRSDVYTLNKELIKFDIDKGIDVPGARMIRENKVVIK